jgi:hypothetical protein
MSGLQWRRFVFFDREVVKDPETHEPSKILEVQKKMHQFEHDSLT